MAVAINSGPIEATDLIRHVPPDRWRELMLARRRFCEINISYDCRSLVQFVNDAQEMFATLKFKSPEAMIREGYGLQPEEIGVAVEWLKLNPPKEPISLEQVKKLAGHGGDRKSEKVKGQVRNTKLKPGTDTRDYILARLDRDGHDKLAAKVRSGEMSANAAAIEAGFRKPPTPLKQILKLIPKLTSAEWQQVRARGDERFERRVRFA